MWTLIPGVPIGCRSPRKRGPYSMPNDTTPPRGDAVAFGYEATTHFDRELHPADKASLRTH